METIVEAYGYAHVNLEIPAYALDRLQSGQTIQVGYPGGLFSWLTAVGSLYKC